VPASTGTLDADETRRAFSQLLARRLGRPQHRGRESVRRPAEQRVALAVRRRRCAASRSSSHYQLDGNARRRVADRPLATVLEEEMAEPFFRHVLHARYAATSREEKDFGLARPKFEGLSTAVYVNLVWRGEQSGNLDEG